MAYIWYLEVFYNFFNLEMENKFSPPFPSKTQIPKHTLRNLKCSKWLKSLKKLCKILTLAHPEHWLFYSSIVKMDYERCKHHQRCNMRTSYEVTHSSKIKLWSIPSKEFRCLVITFFKTQTNTKCHCCANLQETTRILMYIWGTNTLFEFIQMIAITH